MITNANANDQSQKYANANDDLKKKITNYPTLR